MQDDLTDLIARVEAGTAEQQRELLEAAFNATRGPKPEIWSVPYEVHTPEYSAWVERKWKFGAMLEAEAYLDAALMLLPEGWMVTHLSELGGAGGCVCALGNPGTGASVTADAGERTLALALTAAILRARRDA